MVDVEGVVPTEVVFSDRLLIVSSGVGFCEAESEALVHTLFGIVVSDHWGEPVGAEAADQGLSNI